MPDQDFIVEYLQRKNIPVTRANYLEIAYLGAPPKRLCAEEEAELPRQLQKRHTK